MHDLLIIGGGPAGVAAGVYAARKKIKTVLVTKEFGGQSLVSADVQNWIGTKSVSGYDLGKMFEEHLRAQEDIEIMDGDLVTKIEQRGSEFRAATEGGKTIDTRTVLVASGGRRRRLGVPGEDTFNGKGVAYCSICDAPIFKNKTVAVVGGGNAGLEAVIDLLPYAKKIYLLERGAELKGDPVTQARIQNDPKVEIILNVDTKEITGEKRVTGLAYNDLKSGGAKKLSLDGVFVEVGVIPNSECVKGLVDMNKFNEIIVDHKTQRTSRLGIWAAGDVSDVLYKQNNISAGDAVKAVLNIYDYFQFGDRK